MSESLVNKNIIKWYSYTAFKYSNNEVRSAFKILEKINEKMIKIKSHLEFNNCCIINRLLPTYTNIYTLAKSHLRSTIKLLL